jgi:hypothetical protein
MLIWSFIYYQKKINLIIENNDIFFINYKLNNIHKIIYIILEILYITIPFLFGSIDCMRILSMFIINYICFYNNRYIVHSNGIFIEGKNYEYKYIKLYDIVRYSQKYFKVRILINENNKRIYKTKIFNNKHQDKVRKALKEGIKNKGNYSGLQ